MSKDRKESQVQVWNYAGEADLTLGEVHQSKVAKVTLICVVITIVSALALIIWNWAIVYDYIANPRLILTSDTANIEVGSKFDPINYVVGQSLDNANNGDFSYEIVGVDEVVTDAAEIRAFRNPQLNSENKILATYQVHYISKNKARTNDEILTVNVVDNTAPVITLAQQNAFLVQGVQTGEYFDAESYISSIFDDYSIYGNISTSYTLPNWNVPLNAQTGVGEVEVIYSATDEAGNVSSVALTVFIFEDEELRDAFEEQMAEEAVAAGCNSNSYSYSNSYPYS